MVLIALASWLVGCSGPDELPCEDTDGAFEELPRVSLMLVGEEISAEVADSPEERSEAWKDRFCDLDALLWVPDAVGPAVVTLCGVQVSVDLVLIRNAQVVDVDRDRLPCERPCDQCPVYGSSGPDVDAVLWLPAADDIEVDVGDQVAGLEAVALPSAM